MSILGWVLAWCVSGVNNVTDDFGREVEEDDDVLNRSRSKIFQVEDAEFVGTKCLTISTALDCSRNYVRGESLRHLHWFPLEEECLHSFGVLKCLLNLAASCVDDAVRFVLCSFDSSPQLGNICLMQSM